MNLDHLIEYAELFKFNNKIYYKKATTSQKDFIKTIIDDNYEECIKLVHSQDIGITLDGRGALHNELSIYNGGGPFYVENFNLTYEEYHNLIEEINDYADKKDPKILAKDCNCNWEHSYNQYINPHSIKTIKLEIFYYEDHDGLFKSDFYEMLSNLDILKRKMYSDKIIEFIHDYIEKCKIEINII